MSWTADANGVIIKNFFSKKTILYQNMKSITFDEKGINFTTREDEKITQKRMILNFDGIGTLYSAIKKYNISFRDEEELKHCKRTYGIEEINEKAKIFKEHVYELIKEQIKSRFGAEYDVILEIKEENEYINMYLYLTKNGEIVNFADGFDDIVIAVLVEWDSSICGGKYIVTNEVEDEEECKCLIDCTLDYMSKQKKSF